MVEHVLCKHEVTGSIPVASTSFWLVVDGGWLMAEAVAGRRRRASGESGV